MHSIEYGYGLQSFIDLWQRNSDRNPGLNLRNANDFFIPVPRVDSFKKIPLYSFPSEWNNLADELKFQFNRYTFKVALKQHLLESLTVENA
jgi:hypothetical protein